MCVLHSFWHVFHTHISHVCEKLHSETCVKRVWTDVNPFTHFHLHFTCCFTCNFTLICKKNFTLLLHTNFILNSHANSQWIAIRFHMPLHTNFTWSSHENSLWRSGIYRVIQILMGRIMWRTTVWNIRNIPIILWKWKKRNNFSVDQSQINHVHFSLVNLNQVNLRTTCKFRFNLRSVLLVFYSFTE